MEIEKDGLSLTRRYVPDDYALAVGSVEKVTARLQALIEATRADELMVTTMVYDHAVRKHSYELLAKAFALVPQS